MTALVWLFCVSALAGQSSAKLSLARASFYTDDGECAGKARQLSGQHGCGPAKIFWLSPISEMGLDVDANLRFACKGERLYVTQCDDDSCTESCTGWQLVPDISPGDCVGEAVRFNCVPAGDAPRPVHIHEPVGSTPVPQYNALIDLYISTRGKRWSETTNWLQGDPCDGAWFGVKCLGGNITQLTLTGNGLNGTLPSSLSTLKHLEELSLSWNTDLTSKLPDVFGDMKRLHSLYLEGTSFRGRLPPSIGQLASLTQLHLSHTKLQVRLSDVSSCLKLENLSLEKAQHVSGSLRDLAGLTRLHELTLKGNALQGFTLDGIGTLHALRILDVTDTRAEGVIPDDFDVRGTCSLEQLRASKNYISGAIPSSLAACDSLRVLDVGDNFLQGVLPPFARAVKVVVKSNYLTGLGIDFDGPATTLDLSDNPFNVQLPTSLGAAGGSLREFQCHHCGLRGPLPTAYSAALSKLVLHSNTIDGTLERSLADLPNLHTLDLDDNEIGGEVPTTFGRFKGPLEKIRLRRNLLQGTLPEGMMLQQHLSEVMLDDNQLTGTLGGGMAKSGLKFAFDLISVHNNRFTTVSAELLRGMHVTPKVVELEPKPSAESQKSDRDTGDAVRRGYLRLTDNPAAEPAIKEAGGVPGGRPNNFCYASDETHNSIYDDILAEADYAELKPGCQDGTARSLSWKANDCRSFSSFQRGLWYPSTSCLYDKGEFSLNMELMRKMFPREFDFYPPTFRLPYQIGEFRTEFKRQGDEALWLLKPMLSCCGKGIRLVKPESLTEEVVNDVDEHGGWFAMQFVHPPYLVNEQKFVIRVYTVLSSFAPLRMSIYDEPMMFWTGYHNQDGVQTYSTADPRKKDRYITNWFFNNVTATCPLTLTKLAPFLKERGDSVEKLWNSVRDVVVRAMLGVQTRMSRKSRRLNYPNTVYECFIYDIVVTDKLEPKVCEINVDANLAREVNYMDETSPGYPHELDDSFAGDRMEKEDDVFKKNLNRDILRLHGVLPGLTKEQEDAALARVNATLRSMQLDCTDAQRNAAERTGLFRTDMLHPCLEAGDRAELARLELHTSLHDAGADKEDGVEMRTRFQHSFPCFDCAKHLHLIPELHRHDLVGVWWMEQVAYAGAHNANVSIAWPKWVRSTFLAVMAKRVNTKLD